MGHTLDGVDDRAGEVVRGVSLVLGAGAQVRRLVVSAMQHNSKEWLVDVMNMIVVMSMV